MTARLDLLVIGGSAGALEPLMTILGSLPDELEMPVALVLHLAPRQPSLMPQLLTRTSTRRVREPEDKEPLEKRTIYVAPPNYHMLVESDGATIALSVDDPVQFSRPSIDVLFESAAEAFGARTCGIVLSGSNADGADGLARISAAGGLAIVQAPATAIHDAMPRAAAQRTATAIALEPAAMATHVASYCRSNRWSASRE